MNFQGTVVIRKTKNNQITIDALEDMESETMEWKKFLMLSLESSFQESCTISWREFREEILVHKAPTTEKQALWGRISGVISLWKEKVESDYYSVEMFYIGRKKQTCNKRRDSSALLTKA